MPRGVILFDLDGVLVDSRPAIVPCVNHALVAQGLRARPDEELRRLIGPRISEVFAELTGTPADSPLVAGCVATFRERYAVASLRDTAVVPGMADVLAQLHGAYGLGIATSNPLAFTGPLLESLGLLDLFAVVAAPELDAHAEQKADTIRAALDRLGDGRAVMVGDRRHDVEGAHACGLPAIGVTWGFGSPEELRGAGADVVVDDPAAMPAACRALLRDRS